MENEEKERKRERERERERERSSARTLNWCSAGWKADRTRRAVAWRPREETRRADHDGKGGTSGRERRDELVINFGREECGAHVRPGYAFGSSE